MMDSKFFFRDLKSFSQILNLSDDSNYVSAPSDWLLIMTDVRNSTKAIEEGRYKEVNVVGVSAIIVTQNACDNLDIPYVFGGDGATLLVPMSYLEPVKNALSLNRQQSKAQFGLDLRVCLIPLEDLIKAGKEIRVAKLKLSEKNAIAMFRGGGLSLAEKWMKTNDQYLLRADQHSHGEMKGLECRWDPIRSSRDGILSIIVQTQDNVSNPAEVYRDVLTKIFMIAPEGAPVKPEKLRATWPPRFLDLELGMKFLNPFRRALQKRMLLALTWIFAKIIAKKRLDPNSVVSQYLYQLSQNTDYVKFDDVLRMVIDVTTEQAAEIRAALESYRAAGQIYFGLHMADEALMTCFIQSMENHIHFIDGGSGGYTSASKELKRMRGSKA